MDSYANDIAWLLVFSIWTAYSGLWGLVWELQKDE